MNLPVVGIVGTDSNLEYYIKCFIDNKFTIKWIYDPDNKLIDNNIYSLLSCCDTNLIFISGSPSEYANYSKYLYGMGKHVIFNTIVGTNLSDCYDSFLLEQNNLDFLCIVLNPLRYCSVFQSMKNYLTQNSVGQVMMIDCNIRMSTLIKNTCDEWMMDRNMGGGLLCNIVSLYMDLFNYLFQLKFSSVSATIKTLFSRPFRDYSYLKVHSDDFVSATMECIFSGAVINITANSLENNNCYHQHIQIVTNSHIITVKGLEFSVQQRESNIKTFTLVPYESCNMDNKNTIEPTISSETLNIPYNSPTNHPLSSYHGDDNIIGTSSQIPNVILSQTSQPFSNDNSKSDSFNNSREYMAHSNSQIHTCLDMSSTDPSISRSISQLLLCDEDLSGEVNLLHNGIFNFIKLLSHSFINNQTLKEYAKNPHQTLTDSLYIRIFIDAAFESNTTRQHVSISAPVSRILNDEKNFNQLQEKIFKTLELSINNDKKQRSSVSNNRTATFKRSIFGNIGTSSRRPNAVLLKPQKKTDA